MKLLSLLAAAAATVLITLPTGASAEIKVGVTLSVTGPAASLGIPEKNSFELAPATIAGQKVSYIILDDASDSTTAVSNTRKLMTEHKVDVVIGSSITPNSLAMADVVADGDTPMISLASSARIVEPMDAKRRWVFKTPQNDRLMAEALAEHMKKDKVKTLAYIGFNDALGEAFKAEVVKAAEAQGIKVVAAESFNRTDTSVAAQALKILAASPAAVVVGAAGTPAALPQIELVKRGYKGRIYHNHGVANNDFLRVAGKDAEGAYVPVGPVLVVEQLSQGNPIKAVASDYVSRYEAKYGAGSRTLFGAYAWDAVLLLQRAIPEALKTAKPGTVEFRRALRDALEQTRNFPVTNGVVNMSEQDHSGLDRRARVMVRIDGGRWKVDSAD